MANPKYTTFLIALVLVSFFAANWGRFIGEVGGNYGAAFDDSELNKLNRLSELKTQTEVYRNESVGFEEKTGVVDIIGNYFTNGYNFMVTALQSLNIFEDMTEDALSNSALNIEAVNDLKVAIISIVLILLIVGVLISAILKKDV